MLVGNKIDLPVREVAKQEAEELAARNKLKYFDISVKDGTGFQPLFDYILDEICVRLDKRLTNRLSSNRPSGNTVTSASASNNAIDNIRLSHFKQP